MHRAESTTTELVDAAQQSLAITVRAGRTASAVSTQATGVIASLALHGVALGLVWAGAWVALAVPQGRSAPAAALVISLPSATANLDPPPDVVIDSLPDVPGEPTPVDRSRSEPVPAGDTPRESARSPQDTFALAPAVAATQRQSHATEPRPLDALPPVVRSPTSAASRPPSDASEVQLGVTTAELLAPVFNPPPVYPPELLRARVTGVVKLVVTLADDGTVTAARIARSSGYGEFDRAALAIVPRWRFRPQGVTLRRPRELTVPIRFRLDE